MRTTIAVLLGLSMTGCVSWREVQLKTDVENLKREMRALKKGGGGRELSQVRRQLAELTADMETLRTEVGLLTGRLESAQHSGEQNTKAMERVKEDLEAKLARLEEKIALLEAGASRAPVPEATPAPKGAAAPTPPPRSVEAMAPTPAKPKGTPLAAATDKSIYERGLTALESGRFNESRSTFSEVLTRYPKSSLADNARFWIGESFYRQREYATSILEYQKVIDEYPAGDKVPAALYKQGLAFLEIGEKDGGLATLRQLVSKYPRTREAKSARTAIKKAKKR